MSTKFISNYVKREILQNTDLWIFHSHFKCGSIYLLDFQFSGRQISSAIHNTNSSNNYI